MATDADVAPFFDFINKIKDQYPAALTILSQPGVLDVYKQAVAEGWPPERLQAALENTPWWLNTPDSVRKWQALQATDPATAGQTFKDTAQMVKDLESQTGMHLETSSGVFNQEFQFIAAAVTNGWDANRIKYELLNQWAPSSGGEKGANAAQIKSMANDYAVPLSDQDVMSFARQMVQGTMNQQSVQGYLIEQAKSLFPSLTTALNQGTTVKQYVAPYIQIAQQEVGLNPADVNLTDQKWLNLLNQVDPKTGARVSMSLDQALKTIRTDPVWGYDQTHKAGQDATQLANAIQQKFGAAA